MFARLTIAQIRTDMVNEFIKIYEESVIPEARSQKGFCKIYLLIDRKTGNGVSVGFWDSEKDALANEQSLFYQEQLAKFINFYTKPPIREGYEVCLQA